MEIEQLAQVFGMAFVGIIMICIGLTIVEYLYTGMETPGKRNKKLMDNMKKMKNK